ncbi:MAG TPA: tetratricopeptide repeat protein [Bryobacteraceae bacterium]|nr:tetratricopeptide repeat protein [Bryobacteraceae bacterium]
MFSDYPPAYWLLGLALEQQGRAKEAAAEYQMCLKLTPSDRRARLALAHVNGRLGVRQEVLRTIEDYKRAGGQGSNAAYSIALLHTSLGEIDMAFAWLDRAYAGRDSSLPYIVLDPRFDPLRTDERYVGLVRKLKLDR